MKSFVIAALFASAEAVRLDRGDAWPGVILPGSEPILPKPSAKIDLQIGVEAQARSNVRESLIKQLRGALQAEGPYESQLIQLADDDDTVEGARRKAAEMQAQLDKAVADADAKREAQRKAFEA